MTKNQLEIVHINNYLIYKKIGVDAKLFERALDRAADSEPLKSNAKREVYCVRTFADDRVYVKISHAANWFEKIKSCFRNKSKEEFDISCELNKSGIKTVDFLGWGKRGFDSVLFSAELKSSTTARCYCYSYYFKNQCFEEKFIDELIQLVRQFVESNFFHPDLHLGNLLWDSSASSLVVVDPYGIRKCAKFDYRRKVLMASVFGALRLGASSEKLAKMCVDSKLATSLDEGLSLIEDAFSMLDCNLEKNWQKREKQIFDGREKYNYKVYETDGSVVFLRTALSEKKILKYEELCNSSFLLANIKTIDCSADEGRRQWLESFKNEYLMKTGDYPVALRLSADKAQLFFLKH